MSKKPEPEYWVTEITVDYEAREYSVEQVVPAAGLRGIIGPHVLTQAVDEIGAFNEAQKVLNRLGFRVGA